MADRYWIAGTGSWSQTAHWATSSGGSPGASVPTSSDNAIFDAASNAAAYTVTVDATASCLGFTCASTPGASGTITFVLAAALTAAGTLTITGINDSLRRILVQSSVLGTPRTITAAAVSLTNCDFQDVTATVNIFPYSQDLSQWNTYGTATVTVNATTAPDGTNTANRVQTVGVSTKYQMYTGVAGQPYILSAWVKAVSPGSKDVFRLMVDSLTGSPDLTATGTWQKFSVTIASAVGGVGISAGITRPTTSADADLYVWGMQLEIGSSSSTYVVTTANRGASAVWSGTSLGDCLGNTNITVTPSATQYWKTTTTGTKTWSTAANWFLASNGAGGAGRVPLPQDDVVFDASSIGAASTTVSADMPRLGRSITWIGVTNTPTWSVASLANSIYGGTTLVSGMTLAGTNATTFANRTAATITSGTKTFTQPITFNGPGCVFTLADAFATAGALTVTNGTLAAGASGVTALSASIAGTLTKSGTLTLTGSGAAWTATGTITDSGTTVLTDATATDKTFAGGGKTYNNLYFNNAGTGKLIVTGSNTFNEFKCDAQHTIQFTAGTTQTIATLNVNGVAPDANTVRFGQLFGASLDYFSTPDSVANSITGDIDIKAKVSMDDWTPAYYIALGGKYAAARIAYLLELGPDGKFIYSWSANGTSAITKTSSAATGAADGSTLWVRITHDVDNGAGGNDVKFWTSTDGSTWTQLGTTQTTAGTTSIADVTEELVFGSYGAHTEIVSGKIFRATISNAIDGAAVVDFNPNSWTSGTTWTSATGEVWTRNGNAVMGSTNQVVLASTSASTWALNRVSRGSVCNYVSVSNSVASSGYFSAQDSTNAGGNTGWLFGNLVVVNGSTRIG